MATDSEEPSAVTVNTTLTDLDRALLGELLHEEIELLMGDERGIPTPEIHNLMRLWHMMTRNNILVDRDPKRRHPSRGFD